MTLCSLSNDSHFQGCSYVVPKKLKSLLKENQEINLDVSQIEGQSVPNDLISTKLPDKHKFEVGFHLEMIHPVTSRSLERFVTTIFSLRTLK